MEPRECNINELDVLFACIGRVLLVIQELRGGQWSMNSVS